MSTTRTKVLADKDVPHIAPSCPSRKARRKMARPVRVQKDVDSISSPVLSGSERLKKLRNECLRLSEKLQFIKELARIDLVLLDLNVDFDCVPEAIVEWKKVKMLVEHLATDQEVFTDVDFDADEDGGFAMEEEVTGISEHQTEGLKSSKQNPVSEGDGSDWDDCSDDIKVHFDHAYDDNYSHGRFFVGNENNGTEMRQIGSSADLMRDTNENDLRRIDRSIMESQFKGASAVQGYKDQIMMRKELITTLPIKKETKVPSNTEIGVPSVVAGRANLIHTGKKTYALKTYTSRWGKLGVVVDGYRFRMDRATGKKIHWRCSTRLCKSRCTTDREYKFFAKEPTQHNHPKEDERMLQFYFFKGQGTEDPNEAPMEFVSQEAVGHDKSDSNDI